MPICTPFNGYWFFGPAQVCPLYGISIGIYAFARRKRAPNTETRNNPSEMQATQLGNIIRPTAIHGLYLETYHRFLREVFAAQKSTLQQCRRNLGWALLTLMLRVGLRRVRLGRGLCPSLLAASLQAIYSLIRSF